jgi:hypothetical protein
VEFSTKKLFNALCPRYQDSRLTWGFTASGGGFFAIGSLNNLLLLRERLVDIDSSRRGVGG